MELLELFQRLGLALAIGFLVGIERGWKERAQQAGARTAGLRTFALTGLLGGVLAAISQPDRFIVLAIGFLTYSAAVTLFKWEEAVSEGVRGVTTLVAAMLTFALGAYAVVGDMRIAAAAAVGVTALLALKAVLHAWLRRLTWIELRAALVLLAMTFVLLPLLPDRPIDPWGAFNPYVAWLMTILIACVSFSGYIAIRLMGERTGLEISAIAGGLASSTAVTLTFARLAADNPRGAPFLADGALIAGTVMMLRALAVACAVQPELLGLLGPPLIAGAAVTGIWAYVFIHQKPPSQGKLEALKVTNPFDFASVLKFGALLSAMLVLSKWVQSGMGDVGIYGLAAVSGLADVDAITLSVAQMSRNTLTLDAAALAILIVVASNTLVKAAMGWVVGGRAMGLRMLFVSLLAIAVAAAVFFRLVLTSIAIPS